MGRTIRTPEARQKFLRALDASRGNVSEACLAAGMARQSMYDWREADETFRFEWDAIVDKHMDALENEIYRRAYEGTDKPVFYQGEQCGEVKEFSDTLAMFILKGHRPEKYRENVRTEMIGKDGGPIQTSATVIIIPDNGRESNRSPTRPTD